MESNAPTIKAENLGLDDLQLCTICLSSENLSPLSIQARGWLSAALARSPPTSVACVICTAALRTAVRVTKCAWKALEILQSYGTDGHTIISNPLVPLKIKHNGTNFFDYEFDESESIVTKVEPEVNFPEIEIIDWNLWEDEPKTKNQKKGVTAKKAAKRKNSKDRKKRSDTQYIIMYSRGRNKKPKIITPARERLNAMDKVVKECFVIEELSIEEQKEDMQKRRESSNYLHRQYKCDDCFKGYKYPKVFERHRRLYHSETSGPLKCDLCNQRCLSRRALYNHTTRQHLYRYTCRKCGGVFKSRTEASTHSAWHAGKKFVCDICGAEFEHQNSYLGHRRVKHPTGDHVCALCGFSYNSDKGRAYHTLRRHPGEDQSAPENGPECTPCGIRFKSDQALAVHERVSPRHGMKQRNEPSQDNAEQLTRRRSKGGVLEGAVKRRSEGCLETRRRRNQQPVPCEQCGEIQSSSSEYSAHFARKHPTAVRTVFPEDDRLCLCSVCGKTFKSEWTLRTHQLTHSDGALFECNYCQKTFRTKLSLSMHLNTHAQAKPYACARCGMTFTLNSNRLRHEKTVHLETKDVRCEFCEKAFKSKKEVEAHTKHVHFKVPWPKRNRQRTAKSEKRRPPGTEESMTLSTPN